MALNEYSLASIAVARLEEARQAADRQRLLAGLRDPDDAPRARLGRLVVALGLWLGGPTLRARHAWR
jgi:hypothetical protein